MLIWLQTVSTFFFFPCPQKLPRSHLSGFCRWFFLCGFLILLQVQLCFHLPVNILGFFFPWEPSFFIKPCLMTNFSAMLWWKSWWWRLFVLLSIVVFCTSFQRPYNIVHIGLGLLWVCFGCWFVVVSCLFVHLFVFNLFSMLSYFEITFSPKVDEEGLQIIRSLELCHLNYMTFWNIYHSSWNACLKYPIAFRWKF